MRRGFKRVTTILLVTALVLLAGCSKTKLPKLDGSVDVSREELEALTGIERGKLVKAWGEPKTAGNEEVWMLPLDGETVYITAMFADGKALYVNRSYPMFVTVAYSDGGLRLGLVDFEDYTDDFGKLTFLPDQDVFGNSFDPEVGELYLFETNGMIMETFPAQLHLPYSITKMGTVDEAQIEALKEGVEAYTAPMG